MKRERAIYDGSRLYRQAVEGRNELFRQLMPDAEPFKQIINLVSDDKDSSLKITTLEDCREYLGTTRQILDKKSKEISPYIAIPTLMQFITNYYSDERFTRHAPWLGTSLKTTLSLIWENVDVVEGNPTKSLHPLASLVRIAGFYEQLSTLADLMEVFGDGCVYAEPGGWNFVDKDLKTSTNYVKRTFEKRGLSFRTLAPTTYFFRDNMTSTLHAIESVIEGNMEPASMYFKNSLFGTILEAAPDNNEFWSSLWVRLKLLLETGLIRQLVTPYVLSISIFEDLPVAVSENLFQRYSQDCMRDVFWTRDWYKKRSKEFSNLQGMIVERPVTRISGSKGLYVTSPLLLLESINWYVESSVFNYSGYGLGGVSLPSIVFKKEISAPFEELVCESFRAHNFLAGVVNDKGTWITEKKAITLIHEQQQPNPGEIDVLAFHPETHELIVVECKVLAMPYIKNTMKNIVSKLGELDSEGYRAKLKKKVEWLKKTNVVSELAARIFTGFIIVDQYMPEIHNHGFKVLAFEALEAYLTNRSSVS